MNISIVEVLVAFLMLSQILTIFFIKGLFSKMFAFKKQLDVITSDKVQLNNGLNALCHSIEHLEKSFGAMKEVQADKEVQEKTLPKGRSHENTFDYASKLIDMGASLTEVKNTCKLKPQEAELLWAINKKNENQ